ncbi:MAG: Lrp/AsnC family transcriptional regulator [Rhodobacteraceae bacterium]|nr:Lrp/AsnC family transcriptional regulator [Paracoccaceae bacterium]
MELTNKDEHMIMLLRENGRLSVSDLARQLSVSRTAAQMRLKKLERNGVIEGYSARLSDEHTKNRVRALVMIKFPPGKLTEIQQALTEILQITTVYSISGPFDLAAVISAPSMPVLDEVIDEIGCLEGIDDTMSSIILSTKIDR